MRPICWLHISDFHMQKRDAWSQDVVLSALCESIARQRKQGTSVDFILATGDLAFSGKAAEYKLVADFFDAVSTASGVPKDKIFCVLGNHDIDRERQKMCFQGTRKFIESQNQIDITFPRSFPRGYRRGQPGNTPDRSFLVRVSCGIPD